MVYQVAGPKEMGLDKVLAEVWIFVTGGFDAAHRPKVFVHGAEIYLETDLDDWLIRLTFLVGFGLTEVTTKDKTTWLEMSDLPAPTLEEKEIAAAWAEEEKALAAEIAAAWAKQDAEKWAAIFDEGQGKTEAEEHRFDEFEEFSDESPPPNQ